MIKLFSGKQAPTYFETAPAFTHVYDRFHDHDPPATGSDWVNLYDAELRWGDWALGQLVAHLRKIGAYDSTLLIVTADHGEALGEHRYQWHATCPYDEAIRIPLLIRFPHGAGPAGRVGALTETIDLFPTILDLPAPPPRGLCRSASRCRVTGEKQELRDYTFTRTNGRWPCYVVRNHRWALLLYQGGRKRALYDLARDPRQTHNIIAEQPSQAAAMTSSSWALSSPSTSWTRTSSTHHPAAAAQSSPRKPAANSAPRLHRGDGRPAASRFAHLAACISLT
jgi:arylsulfatase A-like enzyme